MGFEPSLNLTKTRAMERQTNTGMMIALLAAIMLRVAIGAPCCWSGGAHAEPAQRSVQTSHVTAQNDAAHDHSGPAQHGEHGEHGEHGDDPTAKPCCSACGPTLPADPVTLLARANVASLIEPKPIRELVTRPPFPAYEATGPPALI